MIVDKQDERPDDWDRHWNDYESSARANPAQEYRRRLVLANLDLGQTSSARVLDIGSGLGDFLVDLHKVHPKFAKLGIELSRRGVEIAAGRLPEARFLQRDLIAGQENAAEYREFATHAVCSEVLEHVDDPVRLLKNARDYMANGCRLVVTVPGGPRSAYDLHIGHRRHFSKSDIRNVLTDAGYTVETATGAGFPFFNLYRLMVIARGARLVADATGKPGALLTMTSSVFDILFKLNLASSPLGWQTVAVARK